MAEYVRFAGFWGQGEAAPDMYAYRHEGSRPCDDPTCHRVHQYDIGYAGPTPNEPNEHILFDTWDDAAQWFRSRIPAGEQLECWRRDVSSGGVEVEGPVQDREAAIRFLLRLVERE